jgi:hypothetical protein
MYYWLDDQVGDWDALDLNAGPDDPLVLVPAPVVPSVLDPAVLPTDLCVYVCEIKRGLPVLLVLVKSLSDPESSVVGTSAYLGPAPTELVSD